jgi:hypothetical protein
MNKYEMKKIKFELALFLEILARLREAVHQRRPEL